MLRSLVGSEMCIRDRLRTKNNTDQCGEVATWRTHNFVIFSFVMPWCTSNTDSSHHVVLQAFVYKTAKPREATNILEYQNIISTQKWKSAASNQQSHVVRSGKKSTKSFGTCLASITLLLLAPRPTSRRPPKRPIAASALPPAGGVVRRVTFALLHAPRPYTLLFSAPQLTRSVPLQEHSLRVQAPLIGQHYSRTSSPA